MLRDAEFGPVRCVLSDLSLSELYAGKFLKNRRTNGEFTVDAINEQLRI